MDDRENLSQPERLRLPSRWNRLEIFTEKMLRCPEGREIENYVPKDLMTKALRATYQKFDRRIKTGQFEHVLPFKIDDGKTIKDVDKVKVAKAVCSEEADLSVLDLEIRIANLVDLIRKANK